MKVEVDSDDLERILFATGVIPKIENALHSYKNDPFVKPHLDYEDAHRRLLSALTAAKRSEDKDLVHNWDDPLGKDEEEVLAALYALGGPDVVGNPLEQKTYCYDKLASKGYVILGQAVRGVVWSNDNRPDISPIATQLVKLTDRGLRKAGELTLIRSLQK